MRQQYNSVHLNRHNDPGDHHCHFTDIPFGILHIGACIFMQKSGTHMDTAPQLINVLI